MSFPPTPRAYALLVFIRDRIAATGSAPSVSEMADALGTVKSHAHRLLQQLEERGRLRVKRNTRGRMRARAIELLPPVWP